MLVFVVLTAAALVAAVGYVAWAALKTEDRPTMRSATAELKLAVAQTPYLVFQYVARGAHYGEVAVTRTDALDRPVFTGLVCERVYASAGRGICLVPKQEPLGSAVTARFFGTDFRPERSTRLDGIATRAR